MKTESITIRLTKGEKEMIRKIVEKRNTTISKYLLKVIKDDYARKINDFY